MQKSHCVNTAEDKHWVEITLRQHRQRRRHWVEIILCQHHRRHSRRRIAKNAHSFCMSLDCRRQDQCISRIYAKLYCRTGVSFCKDAFSAATSHLETFLLEFGAPFASMSSKAFSFAPKLMNHELDKICSATLRRHVPPVVICSTIAPNAGS